MGHQERWAAFDEDNLEVTIGVEDNDEEEKLSLSDLPVVTGDAKEGDDPHPPAAAEDFEFRTSSAAASGGGGLFAGAAEEDMMCAADEVFFNGQILPLRPSVSSDCVLLSDSMDGRSSAAASRFSSRSGSTNSSSSGGFISRSHSTSSFSSATAASGDVPRHSVSNNFYAHPSPRPQVRHGGGAGAVRRRSTGSPPPGWGLFRLGVVKAPEIELSELRSRRSSGGGGGGVGGNRKLSMEPKREKKVAMPPRCSFSEAKKEMRVIRFMGTGLGCRCSPDAVKAAVAPAALHARKEEEEEEETKPRLKRGESTCRRRRIFEWLEELSITKASMR